MPEPLGLVVKNGTNRLCVSARPGPVVRDLHLDLAALLAPADLDPAPGLLRRVDRVAHQVDQQLLQLIGITADGQGRAGLQPHRQPLLQLDHAPQPGAHLDRSQASAGAAGPAGRRRS